MTQQLRVGPVGDTVRHNLRRLRENRRLSLRELSARLRQTGRRISPDAVHQSEQGHRRIDVDDLVALAAILGVRPEVLLTSPACDQCLDAPPAGFTCQTCATST